MAVCAYCSTTIIFGGTKEGDLRFCNDKCAEKGYVLIVAEQISEDMLQAEVDRIHQSSCPICAGPGPSDLHTAYTIWSFIMLTTWNSNPQVSCTSCGRKNNLKAALFSVLLGWWGFPWGIIGTPIQIGRNVIAILTPPNPDQPFKKLTNIAKVNLAAQIVAQDEGGQEQEAPETQPYYRPLPDHTPEP